MAKNYRDIDNPFEKPKTFRGSNSYFKLQKSIAKLFAEQNKCSICGSKDKLEVHHVIHCEKHERLYADKDNLCVLCSDCHHRYHDEYNRINPTTLLEFARRQWNGDKFNK